MMIQTGWYVVTPEDGETLSGPFLDRDEAEIAAEQMESDGGFDNDVAYIN